MGDLEYLKGYQKRAATEGSSRRPMEGVGSQGRERDMYELNDAAIESTRHHPAPSNPSNPSKSTAPPVRDDDDDLSALICVPAARYGSHEAAPSIEIGLIRRHIERSTAPDSQQQHVVESRTLVHAAMQLPALGTVLR